MTDEMKAKRELLFSGSKNGYDRVDQQTLDAMEWIIRAVMIVLFLPMGLAIARILTDPEWRHCS